MYAASPLGPCAAPGLRNMLSLFIELYVSWSGLGVFIVVLLFWVWYFFEWFVGSFVAVCGSVG